MLEAVGVLGNAGISAARGRSGRSDVGCDGAQSCGTVPRVPNPDMGTDFSPQQGDACTQTQAWIPGRILLQPHTVPDPGQALFKQEHSFAHRRDLILGEMSALGAECREKPPKTILRGNKHQALRCPFAALSFLEKPFPPCDLQGGASAPASPHRQWETPALPPLLRPLCHHCQKHGLLLVLGQRLGCSHLCDLLISHSSTSLNLQSSICWAGATTCRLSPQILPCLLTQSSEGKPPPACPLLGDAETRRCSPSTPFGCF